MTQGFTVRAARRDDLGELGEVLGRAFGDDPVMGYVIPHRPLAPRAALLLRTIAAEHVEHDPVFVAVDDDTGRILGGSIWANPGNWKVPVRAYLRHLPTLYRATGLQGFGKIRILDSIERHHPTDDHYYLAVIGTDPGAQGRGIGAALMAPMLRRCDDEGLPAYLESSKESNLGYYHRHGFEVTREFPLHDGRGPSVWFMWRDAPA